MSGTLTMPFYGYDRPGAKISEGVREHWWLQGMLGGMKAHYDCIKAFSETDFTEDLKKMDIPTLVSHFSHCLTAPSVTQAQSLWLCAPFRWGRPDAL